MNSPQDRANEDGQETTRILSPHWEQASAFEPRPGGQSDPQAAWLVCSWGPSRCADALAETLRQNAATVGITRVDVATQPMPVDAGAEADQRLVFFVDETAPLSGADPAEDANWAWAHAVVRACRQTASRPGARVWIVTRTGLNGPGGAREVVRPEHDFAWALGRCHAAESPGSWGGLVDLDMADPAAAARALADYLLSGSAEDEVLLRDEGPFVARVQSSLLPPTASHQSLAHERLQIVSGGAAGLSFEIERWLVHGGAKRLLILGRSPLDGEREENVQVLKSLGAEIEYEVLDVADAAAVRGLTARLRERGDAVGAVFHLASQWRIDGRSCVSSLKAATDAQTRVLLAAKAAGALLLGELAEDLGAEAMVLFSSAAATLGSPGQANYAAANAVLDGVARRLHRGPVRAVSIAWGPIGEAGFGATPEGSALHDAWERLGLRRLTVRQMLDALGMALSQDLPNLTVAGWSTTDADLLPWAADRPALRSLTAAGTRGASLRRLDALADAERVGAIVAVIREQLAGILSCAPDTIDPRSPFSALDVDSLIALEMVFIIEREFDVRLGLDEMLLGMDASITALAERLDRQLRANAARGAESGG
jgi:acyl carrier protein/NADP-dependent 3-hydroxy acid dehydrogenase YdfG